MWLTLLVIVFWGSASSMEKFSIYPIEIGLQDLIFKSPGEIRDTSRMMDRQISELFNSLRVCLLARYLLAYLSICYHYLIRMSEKMGTHLQL